jgi:hypothetical protein
MNLLWDTGAGVVRARRVAPSVHTATRRVIGKPPPRTQEASKVDFVHGEPVTDHTLLDS